MEEAKTRPNLFREFFIGGNQSAKSTSDLMLHSAPAIPLRVVGAAPRLHQALAGKGLRHGFGACG
jgi:hypothetical protein